jgi:glyoxalase family protein
MTIQGLHHITLVTADARRNVQFYRNTLGLRLVKKTVNFDDPSAYHLYYGDQTGSPGSAVTFFEWKGVPQGKPGIGGTHHFALAVRDYDGLLKWKRRLTDLGVQVDGPFERNYFTSIYFRDPDGTLVEIATLGPGWTVDESPEGLGLVFRAPPANMLAANRDNARISQLTWTAPVPAIAADMALDLGMHHITAISSNIQRTHEFFEGLLGMRRVKQTSNFDDPKSLHWYWGVGDGKPGTLVTYFGRDATKDKRAQMGAGQTHHFALSVPDEEAQLVWRDKLMKAGYRVSPVMDRIYFKSIYTNDPDGHIVELATAGPGFAVDEDVAHLGEKLMLPPWLERFRGEIEGSLTPIE